MGTSTRLILVTIMSCSQAIADEVHEWKTPFLPVVIAEEAEDNQHINLFVGLISNKDIRFANPFQSPNGNCLFDVVATRIATNEKVHLLKSDEVHQPKDQQLVMSKGGIAGQWYSINCENLFQQDLVNAYDVSVILNQECLELTERAMVAWKQPSSFLIITYEDVLTVCRTDKSFFTKAACDQHDLILAHGSTNADDEDSSFYMLYVNRTDETVNVANPFFRNVRVADNGTTLWKKGFDSGPKIELLRGWLAGSYYRCRSTEYQQIAPGMVVGKLCSVREFGVSKNDTIRFEASSRFVDIDHDKTQLPRTPELPIYTSNLLTISK